MKRWTLLPILFLFASACSGAQPTDTGPLRGWDGEVVTDPAEIVTATTNPDEIPDSVAFGEATTTAPPSTVPDTEGWINPEFVFQARPSIPGERALNTLYAQNTDTTPQPCVDQNEHQALADAQPIQAFWTDGLGREDGSVVRVSASSDALNDGEIPLGMFRDAFRCEAVEGNFETVIRDVPGLGAIEVYQSPGSGDVIPTWTTGFARNNIFVNVVVQTRVGEVDEPLFDRVASSAFEELEAAVFEDQIFADDLE